MSALAVRRMMTSRLLIDASVWIAAETPGEQFAPAAQELVVGTRWRAAALDLTLYEVANALGAKRGDAGGAAIALLSTDIRDLVSQGLAITPDAAV
jgi:hypothetical protein